MANTGLQPLIATRLTRVIQELQDVREMPQDLKFLGRTAVVNATDAEITERFIGRAQIADIIADDQQAAVYSFGRFSNETVNIPNLKLGLNLTQSQINQLNALAGAGTVENSPLLGMYQRWGEAGLLGVRQRMEALIIAMQTDALTYDRLGIKLNGVTWGMPSDLKVTSTITWDHDSGGGTYDATPVTDTLALKLVASQRYGVNYDRMTLSTTAFNYMTRTVEFINRARLYFSLNSSIAGNVLPLQNVQYMQTLAAPILGMKEIELYDARYWSQDTTGLVTSTRFMPVNQVILSQTSDDNNGGVMDFANAVVVESQVANLIGNAMVGSLPAGQYGPISYATAPPDLNPPNITVWSVARGWPRKWMRASTAVMTVGSFSDAITVGVPFPVG